MTVEFDKNLVPAEHRLILSKFAEAIGKKLDIGNGLTLTLKEDDPHLVGLCYVIKVCDRQIPLWLNVTIGGDE